MAISMDLIKQLRQETGARVLDCQKALIEANGDLEKAKAVVEAKGLARAEKTQDRETKAGYIAAYVHNTGVIAALVELQCETDFVAQNDEFRQTAKDLAMQVVAMNPANNDELLQQDFVKDPEKTVEMLLKALSGKIGEKIVLSKFVRFQLGE